MVRVAVIGSGVLGIKITGELAYHGHEVRVYDHNPETLDRVQLKLIEERRLLREDGLLRHPSFVGQVYCFSRLEETVKDTEIILEAVPEDLSIKQDLVERISHCCRKEAVIGTSAMRLKIDTVMERAAHKERCLGLRFLFPVFCIPEVELTPGKHTSLETLVKVRSFLERMGKTAFLRSGSEPLVLSEEQREGRKAAYVTFLQQSKGFRGRPRYSMPELATAETFVDVTESSGGAVSRDRECVVCMDEERNCVLHPCHHLCTCTTCGRMLLKRQDACPICRKHISSIFRIFHS